MTAEKTQEANIDIRRLYLKDLSYEAPNTPAVFLDPFEPEVDVHLDSKFHSLGDNNFEVILTVTLTANQKQKPLFVVEVKYAGVFLIVIPEGTDITPVVGSFCPTILFPYAREVISNTLTKASFPPLYLSPINFDAYLKEHVAKAHSANETEQYH